MNLINGNPITQGKNDPPVNARSPLSQQIVPRIMARLHCRTSQNQNWSPHREVGTNPRAASSDLISIVFLEFLQPFQPKLTTLLEADPAHQRDLDSMSMPRPLICLGSEPQPNVILRL